MPNIYKRLGGVLTDMSYQRVDSDASIPYGSGFTDTTTTVLNVNNSFIDIQGVPQGTIAVTAQVMQDNNYQYADSGRSISGTNVAGTRARYWTDNSIAISWEVGRGQQIVYVHGVTYSLASLIGSDCTIRAACLLSAKKCRLLVKNHDGSFWVTSIDLGLMGIISSLSISAPSGNTIHSAFLSTTSIVRVLSDDTRTYACKNVFDSEWKLHTELWSCGMNANGAINSRQDLGRGSSAGSMGYSTGNIATTKLSTNRILNDSVTLTGQRVVACNSDSSKLYLLVENVNTSCVNSINRPAYGQTESLFQYFHPVIIMGFNVGKSYDQTVDLTAYDSGKLTTSTLRNSENSYTRIVIDCATGIATSGSSFSGGTFDSNTAFYERYANNHFVARMTNLPAPMDITSLATFVTARDYGENSYIFQRTWVDSIKFYACDPLTDTYYYLRQNGTANYNFINYDVDARFSPATDDLINPNVLTGTVELIARVGDTETVIFSRDMKPDIGVSVANRRDLNFEPTMPYYTQQQAPYAGTYNWANTISTTIGKSINLCWQGRYVAKDNDKTGFAVNLVTGFDTPSFDIPTLSIDARHNMLTEGAVLGNSSSSSVLRPFLDAYRPNINKNGTPIDTGAIFDPQAPLDLDMRTFDDYYKITSPTNLITSYVTEWADIRGWCDFRNRAGINTWDECSFIAFKNNSNLYLAAVPNSPPISLMDVL